MKDFRLIVVDDEEAMRESLVAWLQKGGYPATAAAGGAQALKHLEENPCDLALIDIKMPGMDGHELLQILKEREPQIMAVMMTAYGSIQSAVTAMKQGADDYLLKPFDPEHLMLLIEKLERQKEMRDEHQVMRARIAEWESARFEDMIGQSAAMKEVYARIEEVALADTPVLITGETGAGKELVARAVHSRSARRKGPFIAINCGAAPEHLLESELFGHEHGAFTGAVKMRLGRLEMANNGALFLDEVGDITERMQVQLLRALEEKVFLRLGGQREIASDFRLISATHRDLPAMVQSGRFRSDFYYRINVFAIRVPSLRERLEDVPLLADHFLLRFAREMGKNVQGLTAGARRLLKDYDWPATCGNCAT